MTPEEARVVAAYEESLRGIAAATVRARSRVRGFNLPAADGAELLVECERWLSALIVLGAVPSPPRPPETLPGPRTLPRGDT